jgi:hypothetical protein
MTEHVRKQINAKRQRLGKPPYALKSFQQYWKKLKAAYRYKLENPDYKFADFERMQTALTTLGDPELKSTSGGRSVGLLMTEEDVTVPWKYTEENRMQVELKEGRKRKSWNQGTDEASDKRPRVG